MALSHRQKGGETCPCHTDLPLLRCLTLPDVCKIQHRGLEGCMALKGGRGPGWILENDLSMECCGGDREGEGAI